MELIKCPECGCEVGFVIVKADLPVNQSAKDCVFVAGEVVCDTIGCDFRSQSIVMIPLVKESERGVVGLAGSSPTPQSPPSPPAPLATEEQVTTALERQINVLSKECERLKGELADLHRHNEALRDCIAEMDNPVDDAEIERVANEIINGISANAEVPVQQELVREALRSVAGRPLVPPREVQDILGAAREYYLHPLNERALPNLEAAIGEWAAKRGGEADD